MTPGCLFVPLVAERDGHDFIGAAMKAGAGAHLTSGPAGPGPALRVPAPAEARRRGWRRQRPGAAAGTLAVLAEHPASAAPLDDRARSRGDHDVVG